MPASTLAPLAQWLLSNGVGPYVVGEALNRLHRPKWERRLARDAVAQLPGLNLSPRLLRQWLEDDRSVSLLVAFTEASMEEATLSLTQTLTAGMGRSPS